jgi:hypothetical protein
MPPASGGGGSPRRNFLEKRHKNRYITLDKSDSSMYNDVKPNEEATRMKASKIIEKIMKDKGMSKAALGRAVGISDEKNKSQPTDTINKRLKQKSIGIDVIAEMADKMDYQVLIVPKGVTVRSDWYKVEDDGDE